MSRQQLESIIAQEKPGFVMVPANEDHPATAFESTGAAMSDQSRRPDVNRSAPGLDYLRQKFFGTDAAASVAPIDPTEDVEIVQVMPAADVGKRGKSPKAVVVSKKQNRIVGEQG